MALVPDPNNLWMVDDIDSTKPLKTWDRASNTLGPPFTLTHPSPFNVGASWNVKAINGDWWTWNQRSSPTERWLFHFDSSGTLIDSFQLTASVNQWRQLAFTPTESLFICGRTDGVSSVGKIQQRSTTDGSVLLDVDHPDIRFEGLTWGTDSFWATAYNPSGQGSVGFIHKVELDGSISDTFSPPSGIPNTSGTLGALAWGGDNTLLIHDYNTSDRFHVVDIGDGSLVDTVLVNGISWITSPFNQWMEGSTLIPSLRLINRDDNYGNGSIIHRPV